MKKGFTLIELLIVVAIIAILAAIAVPNFLEAQVRSKVGRVYADLRTLGISINSYRVDHNHNPPGYTTAGIYNTPNNTTRHRCYVFMTTPIAYLSSFPQDPFDPRSRPEAKYYFYNDFEDPAHKHPGFPPDSNGPRQPYIEKSGFTWGAYSAGPTRAEITPSMETAIGDVYGFPGGNIPNAWGAIYDPTNGTVSRGRIAYSNKGFLAQTGY